MSDSSFKVVTMLSLLVMGLGSILGAVSIWGDNAGLERIVQYFGTAVPIILGFAFTAHKQEQNDDKTEETRQNVGYLSGTLNGKLDTRFARIEEKIDRVATDTGSIPVVMNRIEANDAEHQ